MSLFLRFDRLHIISEVYELGKAGALVKAAYPGCAEGIVSCQHPLAEGMRAKKSANTAFPKEELCA